MPTAVYVCMAQCNYACQITTTAVQPELVRCQVCLLRVNTRRKAEWKARYEVGESEAVRAGCKL